MTIYGTRALALAFILSLGAGVAHAQLLQAGTAVGIDIAADGTTSTGSASTNAGITGDSTVDNQDTPEEATSTTDAMLDFGVGTNGGLDFSVTRDSLSGDESTDSMTAAEVSSSASLKAYAERTVSKDSNLEEVSVSTNGLNITYRKKARFLGVIPSGMNVKVHVASSGNVDVDYPWYAFLMASGESKTEFESRLEEKAISASAMASVSEESEYWAHVLERIQAELSADASVKAS